MRTARITSSRLSYYHCLSRVVDGQFIFKDEEKHYFRWVMRGLEHFMGIRVVTYCIMSNHFHVLLEVPAEEDVIPADEVSDEALVELIRPLYGNREAKALATELANCDQWNFERKKHQIRDQYLARRGRLDLFMKGLKQRFTQYYNRKVGRRGTLWEDRYKSVMVGNSNNAILSMAAYIDLNPVRAAMVGDPADYQFSGYGEACAGVKIARRGLAVAMERENVGGGWKRLSSEYRRLLYGVGGERGIEENGEAIQKGFSREEVLAEIEAGCNLPLWKVLRCRVRYMSDGAIFGTSEFIEEVFMEHRDRFSVKRQSGYRAMAGGDWGGLGVLRDLRRQVFG